MGPASPLPRSPRRPAPWRRLALAGAVALALAVAGCAGPGRDGRPVTGQGAPAPDLPSALDAMLRPASELDAATWLAGLPEPHGSEIVAVPNPHDPRRTNAVRTLHYDGLDLSIYEVAGSGERFPVAAVVTGSGLTTREGLRVGLSRAEVRALVGEPTRATAERWVYEIVDDGLSAPYELELAFADGIVARIAWRAYLD